MQCPHLEQVLKSPAKTAVLKTYAVAVRVAQNGPPEVTACSQCSNRQAYICLQCPQVQCIKHFAHHSHKSGHVFGIAPSGELMCFRCGNFVIDDLLLLIQAGYETDYDYIAANSVQPSYRSQLGLLGFVNMGATCFMSSILQVLIHSPFVMEFYLHRKHNSQCTRDPCISCSVDGIFTTVYGNARDAEPEEYYGFTQLLGTAWKLKKSLAGSSEQDAHEFLQFLLDQLHKEHDPVDSDRCDCITHSTFAGKLLSQISCDSCHHVNKTVDPMVDISVEIKNKKNLEQCLENFTTREHLDSYRCPNCSDFGAYKKLSIQQFPPLLAIQLKRFEHVAGQSTKIDSFLSFPEYLDMSQYGGPQGLNYELTGIVAHIGSVNTGHYIAIINEWQTGRWFKFNDSMITQMSVGEVMATKAYLLFYTVH